MIYGERDARSAFFVRGAEITQMRRMPLMFGTRTKEWIQSMIEADPSLLPSDRVASEYSGLVCIGKNIPLEDGGEKFVLDNLYVTRDGHLVLVSVELFRDQHSRREVVDRLMRCAHVLQRMDAESLDEIAEEYFYEKERQAARVVDVMAREGHLTFENKADFIDSLNDHMMEGAFLLLVVGDGIRSAVYGLAEQILEDHPMSFDLALVELELYERGDGLIVIPSLLAKTAVIEKQRSGYSATITRAPTVSRKQFVLDFSSLAEYDPDLLIEFILDVEKVSGVSVALSGRTLSVMCKIADGYEIPALGFSINGGATTFVQPDKIHSSLSAAGRYPAEADGYLGFLNNYVDPKQSGSLPFEFGVDRTYYLQTGKILENPQAFVGAIESLMAEVIE